MGSPPRKLVRFSFIVFFVFISGLLKAQSEDPATDPVKLSRTILQLDSLFWQAYNQCDVDKMATFFTKDLEFYHDKSGLTAPLSSLMESIRTGLCSNPDWRIRRVADEESVKVYPLNKYGALISGDHFFYISETGKKEYLSGQAKFTHVWQYKNNEWKMSRVLSYDHGPARKEESGGVKKE